MVGRHHATREGRLGRKATSHDLGACLHVCGLASLRIGLWVYGNPWCLKSLSDNIKVELDGCNRVLQDLGPVSQVLPKEQGYLGEQSCVMNLDGTREPMNG